MGPMPRRQYAPCGKQHAYQKFLAGKGTRPLERELRRIAPRVYAGEINQSRGGQYRVARAGQRRHKGEDNCRGEASRRDGHGQKRAPVAPMKLVTLAQRLLRRLAQSRESVEQAIAHIHGPRGERQQYRNPQRQPHASRPRKSQRPDNSHRGRIKTGQMPKGKRSRSAEDAACIFDAVRNAVVRR